MLKALLKKQFAELLSAFAFRSGEKKQHKTGMLVLVGILMLYALAAMVYLMWTLSDSMCQAMLAIGKPWVYFAFMGTLAFGTGLIGSVFMTKSILYEAKDNDLLLSMPIPPKALLLVRMIALYAMAFLFTSIAFIPCIVRYFTLTTFSVLPLIFCILITLLLPLGVLAVSCLLGWLIAVLTARLPAKNLITTVLLIAFFIGYAVLVSNMNEVLTFIMTNGEALAQGFENPLLLVFRQMGVGAAGDILSMVVFTLIFVGVFALTYLLLSVTFLKTATMKKSGAKAKYVERQSKSRSAFWAIFFKECNRYLKNPMILFNCGIGSVLCVVFAGFALFNGELCSTIAHAPIYKGEVAIIVTVILCFIAASNIISASSISLEGQNLWLLRSMPVSAMEIFGAKTAFHVAYTIIPLAPVTVLICVLLEIPVLMTVCAIVTLICITLLCATLGLVINLKMPNLKWTNEIVAVKQSFSVLLAMFACWGVSLLVIGGYFLFGKYLYAELYLTLVSCLFVAVSALLWWWVYKRGVRVFETL